MAGGNDGFRLRDLLHRAFVGLHVILPAPVAIPIFDIARRRTRRVRLFEVRKICMIGGIGAAHRFLLRMPGIQRAGKAIDRPGNAVRGRNHFPLHPVVGIGIGAAHRFLLRMPGIQRAGKAIDRPGNAVRGRNHFPLHPVVGIGIDLAHRGRRGGSTVIHTCIGIDRRGHAGRRRRFYARVPDMLPRRVQGGMIAGQHRAAAAAARDHVIAAVRPAGRRDVVFLLRLPGHVRRAGIGAYIVRQRREHAQRHQQANDHDQRQRA